MNRSWYITANQAKDICSIADSLGLPTYDSIAWNGHYFVVSYKGKSVARIYVR